MFIDIQNASACPYQNGSDIRREEGADTLIDILPDRPAVAQEIHIRCIPKMLLVQELAISANWLVIKSLNALRTNAPTGRALRPTPISILRSFRC